MGNKPFAKNAFRWAPGHLSLAGLGLAILVAETTFGLRAAQRPDIRVEVDLVNINVTVTDKHAQAVRGLKKENFRVYENEAEQEIRHFSTEDVPYTIGLVLDRSGSMEEIIDDVFQAAFHTLEASKPEDEVFVVVFSQRIELVQDFTVDREAVQRALRKVRAGGSTALYDAVHTALSHIRRGQYQKKALLVVTDGEDNVSGTRYRELLDFAQENSAVVYAIGLISDPIRFGSLQEDSPALERLSRLAEVTGGKAYFPKNMKQCRQACLDTARDLRHQYSLGYYPTNREKDGKWRKIRVELVDLPPDLSEHAVVGTRAGYYAVKE